MQQIRKLSENVKWFEDIVNKAKTNYKMAHKEITDFDENKITRDQFRGILEHISLEADLRPPTKEEALQVFNEFNKGKLIEYIQKQEFELFCKRAVEMLTAINQS